MLRLNVNDAAHPSAAPELESWLEIAPRRPPHLDFAFELLSRDAMAHAIKSQVLACVLSTQSIFQGYNSAILCSYKREAALNVLMELVSVVVILVLCLVMLAAHHAASGFN